MFHSRCKAHKKDNGRHSRWWSDGVEGRTIIRRRTWIIALISFNIVSSFIQSAFSVTFAF